ncbi:YaaA family protein [Sulfurimonas sp.]|uniref:YaaA family protein n=1 Tax=Sulfurimonas sp. TaxID=2022749 RepID=UPI0025F91693|nr:YaaA family protein [Sulfurimonas sp.]MDD5157566.1 YaaA family protein [Sulfurimonas sp.]
MLKILFSPSENKRAEGKYDKKEIFGSNSAREEILKSYNEIVCSGNEEKIKNLFGLKKISDAAPYISDIFNSKQMCAIERYCGVAYKYLDFNSLEDSQKEFVKANTVIFSNLYGPILGGDLIANYKVKQGSSIGEIAPEKFYSDRFSYQLDLYLANCDILDLRAGYYDKFYKIKKPCITLKFLKDSKVVSHWAKAYRGLVLRAIAQNNITSTADFMRLEIENLAIKEIVKKTNITEIVYDIR